MKEKRKLLLRSGKRGHSKTNKTNLPRGPKGIESNKLRELTTTIN